MFSRTVHYSISSHMCTSRMFPLSHKRVGDISSPFELMSLFIIIEMNRIWGNHVASLPRVTRLLPSVLPTHLLQYAALLLRKPWPHEGIAANRLAERASTDWKTCQRVFMIPVISLWTSAVTEYSKEKATPPSPTQVATSRAKYTLLLL